MGSYDNQSLARAFDILERLADALAPLTVAEVSRQTGLHRATVHRILAVLSRMGYVHKSDRDSTYSTGFYLHTFGHPANIIASVARHARPFLEGLAHRFEENVVLGALEGIQMVVCDKVALRPDVGVKVAVGTRLDAHAAAIGKVLLAYRVREDVARLFEHHRLTTHTKRTVSDLAALQKELAVAHQRGWAIENEEYAVGRRAVAAAIVNPMARAACAIAVEGPSSRLINARLAAITEAVTETAGSIAHHIVKADSPARRRQGPMPLARVVSRAGRTRPASH